MIDVKKFLQDINFNPSKKMGQNFLIDKQVIYEICNHIPNLSKYSSIIEIGPGLSAITSFLVRTSKKIFAIELDKRLCDYLHKRFGQFPNLKIINDDFLEIDLNKYGLCLNDVLVFANIPYSITSPIILKCLSNFNIKTLYIMIQKEVANKWDYQSTSSRNALSNILNYYFVLTKVLDISRNAFFPIPKVDSTMVILDKRSNEKYDCNFYNFIQMFFFHKRKKIINNSPFCINKKKFIELLTKLGYDVNIRPEVLAYNHWKWLYDNFKNEIKSICKD